LLERLPRTLSGGEQQKVALARALIIKPTVLLLDEPFSSLDPESRENLQEELLQLQRLLNITTIHVTHDFEEAVAMGHRIAVIGQGQLKQVGTPEQIFRHPNSEFVARFAMTRNIFTGKVVHGVKGRPFFVTDGTNFLLSGKPSGAFHATIRPEDIILSHEPFYDSDYNCLSGVITRIIDKGSTLLVTVNLPPDISCLATRRSVEELRLVKGEQIYAVFKASSIHLF
jgi:molybdopterin-binding protein